MRSPALTLGHLVSIGLLQRASDSLFSGIIIRCGRLHRDSGAPQLVVPPAIVDTRLQFLAFLHRGDASSEHHFGLVRRPFERTAIAIHETR